MGDPVGTAAQSGVMVYDIINCGPRKRFTVSGLLVSNCLIVDFVGNSGEHKLMTSADILGGNVSDEAIARANKRAKESGCSVNMSNLLDEEEAKVREEALKRQQMEAARKARLIARVKFTAKSINPFSVFDLEPHRERGWDNGRSLSEKQRALLLKQGVVPDELTYTQATQVIREMFRRWGGNLCSLKQAAVLKRYGYETKNLTRVDASKLLDQLAQNNWRKVVTKG